MNRKPKRSTIEVRREQVEAAIAKLKSPQGIQTRRDFKTDNLYAVWKEKYDKRLNESTEELTMLDNPADYNEVPLAVAAEELGLTLQQVRDIIDDELIEISFDGEYRLGARVTRDELARAIEAGPQQLLRIAHQPVEEIYEETIRQLHRGDVAAAELLFDRLERNCSWESYQYETAARIGLKLLRGDLDGIEDELEFRYHNTIEIAARLKEIRRVVQGVKTADHPSAIAREQILAVTDGAKLEPSKDAPYRFSKEPMSAMDESQRTADRCSVHFPSHPRAGTRSTTLVSRLSFARSWVEGLNRGYQLNEVLWPILNRNQIGIATDLFQIKPIFFIIGLFWISIYSQY